MNSYGSQDAIVAISTGAQRSAISVVRLSAPSLANIITSIFSDNLYPKQATLATLKDEHNETLDQGILIYYPAPNSYTGEDVIEFQGHGNPIIQQSILQYFVRLGCRLADAGEFTLRAFLNGKMDLVQAESVADLINANCLNAAKASIQNIKGELSSDINGIFDRLLELRVLVEAKLDFDEDDAQQKELDVLFEKVLHVIKDIERLLDVMDKGQVLRDGLSIVLLGKPNTGKSSIINYMLGENRAIVTDIAGTTRDLLRFPLHIQGGVLHVTDTAGIQEGTDDPIEEEGISRALSEAQQADLVFFVVDAQKDITQQVEYLITKSQLQEKNRENFTVIRNKIDLNKEKLQPIVGFDVRVFDISVKSGQGLDALEKYLHEVMDTSYHSDGVVMAKERHLNALNSAKSTLNAALSLKKPGSQLELLAERLKEALDQIGEITGKVSTEDVLGQIFSNFCVGK